MMGIRRCCSFALIDTPPIFWRAQDHSNLKSKWREEFLGCLTDGEAKAEAIEIMVSSLEDEKDYLDDLISGMKEMEVQDETE